MHWTDPDWIVNDALGLCLFSVDSQLLITDQTLRPLLQNNMITGPAAENLGRYKTTSRSMSRAMFIGLSAKNLGKSQIDTFRAMLDTYGAMFTGLAAKNNPPTDLRMEQCFHNQQPIWIDNNKTMSRYILSNVYRPNSQESTEI